MTAQPVTQRDAMREWLLHVLEQVHPADGAAICSGYLGERPQSWPIRPLLYPGADERLARDAIDALCRVHRDVATQICEAMIAEHITDGPKADIFGHLRRDAQWWAELATVPEVQAYVVAGLLQLQERAIGHKARKEVLAALWKGMRPEDQGAFLRAIGVGQ